jgi:hypothetical protein
MQPPSPQSLLHTSGASSCLASPSRPFNSTGTPRAERLEDQQHDWLDYDSPKHPGSNLASAFVFLLVSSSPMSRRAAKCTDLATYHATVHQAIDGVCYIGTHIRLEKERIGRTVSSPPCYRHLSGQDSPAYNVVVERIVTSTTYGFTNHCNRYHITRDRSFSFFPPLLVLL